MLKIHLHEKAAQPFNPKTVTINGQTWMSKNLDINDGGKGIETENGNTYYTWDAAMRIASSIPGWHLPTNSEWYQLIDFCGGYEQAAVKLKASTGWYKGFEGTDDFGMSIIACDDNVGTDTHKRSTGFWTSNKPSSNDAVTEIYIAYSIEFVRAFTNGYNCVRLIKD